jgi:hypothetical protein
MAKDNGWLMKLGRMIVLTDGAARSPRSNGALARDRRGAAGFLGHSVTATLKLGDP